MTTYAIGDIQGCFQPLMQLLEKIHFDAKKDVLWLTGDLINRGPQSLETLRFIKSLQQSQVTVLGNHDIHLLAAAYGVRSTKTGDTLDAILTAPDKIELIEWLRHQPLLHVDGSIHYVMSHAGIAPIWSIDKAKQLAKEVETVLQGNHPDRFLKELFGPLPDLWQDSLQGVERLRCIINYFTRMRFCYADGRLDFAYKGEIANKPDALMPWFALPHRVPIPQNIIFGHWAALNACVDEPHLFPLDTGCVWGNCLTALRLPDGERMSVRC